MKVEKDKITYYISHMDEETKKKIDKEMLEKKKLDQLIKLFCDYFNINHVALDIMYLVEEEKLKEYIVNQFVFNLCSFTKEELEEIENREF